MKLTSEQKLQISHMKLVEGLSSREIARRVLGSASKKSTVNDYLRKITPISTPNKYKGPKILILDIETAPCMAYYWKRWKENISESQAISESFILTYAASWLGSNQVIFNYLTPNEVTNEDDSKLVKELYELLSQADIVVAHNALNFDIPVIHTRLLFNGFTEPLPFKVVDTLKITKKYFRFPSNSLESIANYLKLESRKSKPVGGFELWKGYMQGKEEAIVNMINYNMDDVVVLEELYLKIRSWDKLHPNVSLYDPSSKTSCPVCGSYNIVESTSKAYTNLSAYKVYECQTCGKKSRDRTNIINRSKLLTNIQL